jgi:hypothetical protein
VEKINENEIKKQLEQWAIIITIGFAAFPSISQPKNLFHVHQCPGKQFLPPCQNTAKPIENFSN